MIVDVVAFPRISKSVREVRGGYWKGGRRSVGICGAERDERSREGGRGGRNRLVPQYERPRLSH